MYWHIIIHYFKKGKSKKKKKDLCHVWRRCYDCIKCVKSGFEVSCWRFLLDNPPLYGRPVEVYMDQMEILIENSQYYTTQEIASTLKISKLSTKNNL